MALKYATRFADKVEKLVLIAPSGIVPARLSFAFKSIFYAMQGEKGLKKIAQLILGIDEILDEVTYFNNLIGKHFTPIIGGLPVFTDDELKRLTMPVMLICGENDVTLNVDNAAKRLNETAKRAAYLDNK